MTEVLTSRFLICLLLAAVLFVAGRFFGRRVLIGLLLTVILLVTARRLSTRRGADIVVEEAGMRISHRTVTEQVEAGEPVVGLSIEPKGHADPWIIVKEGRGGEPKERLMEPAGDGRYESVLPDLGKGKRFYYAFRIEGAGGEVVRIPARPERFFFIKFKGRVSRAVLALHIIFMFGAFYFMIQSLIGAILILRRGVGKAETVRMTRWVVLFTFVGGWPLGFILNYQAFGPVWEGFPFGYDITDNKTQIMFVFWLVTVLLVRGSFFGRGEEKDSVGAGGFALAVVLSFVISLALFILPHSL